MIKKTCLFCFFLLIVSFVFAQNEHMFHDVDETYVNNKRKIVSFGFSSWGDKMESEDIADLYDHIEFEWSDVTSDVASLLSRDTEWFEFYEIQTRKWRKLKITFFQKNGDIGSINLFGGFPFGDFLSNDELLFSTFDWNTGKLVWLYGTEIVNFKDGDWSWQEPEGDFKYGDKKSESIAKPHTYIFIKIQGNKLYLVHGAGTAPGITRIEFSAPFIVANTISDRIGDFGISRNDDEIVSIFSDDEVFLLDAVFDVLLGKNKNRTFLAGLAGNFYYESLGWIFLPYGGTYSYLNENRRRIFLLDHIDASDHSLKDYFCKTKHKNVIIPIDINLFHRSINFVSYNTTIDRYKELTDIYDSRGADEIFCIQDISIGRTNQVLLLNCFVKLGRMLEVVFILFSIL